MGSKSETTVVLNSIFLKMLIKAVFFVYIVRVLKNIFPTGVKIFLSIVKFLVKARVKRILYWFKLIQYCLFYIIYYVHRGTDICF